MSDVAADLPADVAPVTVAAQTAATATPDDPARTGAPRYLARLRELSTGLLAAVVLAAIAGLAAIGPAALGAGLFVAQLVLSLAWLAAVDARGSRGGLLIAALAAGVGDVVLGIRSDDALGQLAAVVGLAFGAALLHQLARRPRPAAVASMAATLSCVVLGACLGPWLALHVVSGGDDAAVCSALAAAACLAAGRIVDAVVAWPVIGHPASARRAERGLPGLVVGLGAAAGVGALVGGSQLFVGAGIGLRLGLTTALLAVIGDFVGHLAADNGRKAVVPLTILLPAVLSGPAAYVAGRFLLG